MPDECHPEKCPVGVSINAKVEMIDERVRAMEVVMATITTQLVAINGNLKKAIIERYAYLFVGVGFAYLLQRAFN